MSENNGRTKRLDREWDEGKDGRRRFDAPGRADIRPPVDRSRMICAEPKSGVGKNRLKTFDSTPVSSKPVFYKVFTPSESQNREIAPQESITTPGSIPSPSFHPVSPYPPVSYPGLANCSYSAAPSIQPNSGLNQQSFLLPAHSPLVPFSPAAPGHIGQFSFTSPCVQDGFNLYPCCQGSDQSMVHNGEYAMNTESSQDRFMFDPSIPPPCFAGYQPCYPEFQGQYPAFSLPVNPYSYPANTTSYPVNSASYPVNTSNYPVNISSFPVNSFNYPVDSSSYLVSLSSYPMDPASSEYSVYPQGCCEPVSSPYMYSMIPVSQISQVIPQLQVTAQESNVVTAQGDDASSKSDLSIQTSESVSLIAGDTNPPNSKLSQLMNSLAITSSTAGPNSGTSPLSSSSGGPPPTSCNNTVDRNSRSGRDTSSSSISYTVGPGGDGAPTFKVGSGRGVTPDIVKSTETKLKTIEVKNKNLWNQIDENANQEGVEILSGSSPQPYGPGSASHSQKPYPSSPAGSVLTSPSVPSGLPVLASPSALPVPTSLPVAVPTSSSTLYPSWSSDAHSGVMNYMYMPYSTSAHFNPNPQYNVPVLVMPEQYTEQQYAPYQYNVNQYNTNQYDVL